MSNIFSLNLKDVISSVISGGIVALLTFIGQSASIFAIDWQQALSITVLAMVASLLKSFGTTTEGKFLGIQIK